jgi:ligand-binding sensor protein
VNYTNFCRVIFFVKTKREPSINVPVSGCMSAVGTCVLIIDGRRSGHFELSVPVGVDQQVYAFLSGPVRILKQAQRSRQLQLELSDATLVDIGLLQVNDTGIGLIMMDPRTIPAPLRPHQT